VADTGCTGSADLIACLRTVPIDKLMTAVNKAPNAFSFTSVRLGWQPSVDGQIIVRSPQESLQKGLYARVHLQSLSFNFSPAEGHFLTGPDC
jgi:acetylcholinesterase